MVLIGTNMDNTKIWYTSKIFWASIITFLLGAVPIVGTFLRLILPNAAVIIDGVAVMVTGLLILAWRIWFTDSALVF
jgi:hypothetical protein